ncbi:hypothetical protein [Bacillus suaedaesalsae]|uniref:Antitoxin VbhA domain-containing protein n=1 Tax=Bacillus suaedaesalsae TaxID=2810349 RepID=A0ABS2DJY5_9BACI|nr:hypothetical protein [Bacillus suaedaesalsae]MBM6618753.1 hypothetical protein [Bacillus suaedaesalsae]
MKKQSEGSIKKAMRNAKASLEISGYSITNEHEALIKSKLKGEISEEEFLRCAFEMVQEVEK